MSNELGVNLLRQRRFAEAARVFEECLSTDPTQVGVWLNLAMSSRGQQNSRKEFNAVIKALELNPFDPMALLMKASWFERTGHQHEASTAYRAALVVADQQQLVADASFRPLMNHARQFLDAYQSRYVEFLDRRMADVSRQFESTEIGRLKRTLDTHLGRRNRFDSKPTGLFFHELPAIEFFSSECFPWISELEAQTDAIRAECLQALTDEANIHPYLTYGNDQPLQQWAELNRNPRWSAYHLLKDGVRVEPNASHCPATMAALTHIPQPLQVGRTPVAMFSLLKPGTHIPPHVGVSNVRLVAHLPLIVPPNCALRVGGQTHRWEEGRVCVFDDTIEHEAWNRSDQLRAVLIFDVWHPELTGIERQMVSALAQAIDDFNGQHEAMPL